MATEPKIRRYVLPLPPSVNSWKAPKPRNRRSERTGIMGRSAKATIWLGIAQFCLRVQGVVEFGSAPVVVDLYIHCHPSGTEGDIDNYSKGTLDALTRAQIWTDDDQVVQLHKHRRGRPPGGGVVVVDIRVATPEEIEQSREIMPEAMETERYGF
jgi:Holliday junction resolvase RusA-like endonuclease